MTILSFTYLLTQLVWPGIKKICGLFFRLFMPFTLNIYVQDEKIGWVFFFRLKLYYRGKIKIKRAHQVHYECIVYQISILL
jgi:hypothetical protein